ncbi:MAG TPA: CHC2 zinc finger domain-containing protein, partial [Actinomycetota bacterium]|nr:CHC2 zinc finger domain-containing protein [Actinomycetota bacterium]
MAGRIRQENVDAVRQRSDIVKVVGEHLQLKKAGADSMVGICPFHPEKTASFSVSPSKQVYYCFGCGEGGDLFRFLQKIENLSFTEAVERLAVHAGITLRYEGETKGDRQRAGRRQALHHAVADAGELYHRLLLEGREATEARAYLTERGIGKESVERFGVGYAPTYSDFLLRRLTRKHSAELLV